MPRQDFKDFISRIGAMEKIEDVRVALVEMDEAISKDYDSQDQLVTDNEKYKNDNESLRAANMKLFLHVGSKTEPGKDNLPGKKEEELKYEDLFNEKGELK